MYLLQQKRTTINSDNLFNDTLSYILKSKVTLVTNFIKYYLITPYKIMLKINQQIIFCFLIYLLLFSSCQKRTKSSPTNTFELNEITIDEIHNGYDSGKYTVREIVSQYIKRIENIDQSGPELNSIIIVTPDALAIADSLDKIQKKGNYFLESWITS